MAEFPAVPLTVEGSAVLHQVFSFDWKTWRSTPFAERAQILAEAVSLFRELEGESASPRSALFSVIGHKGDLMTVHFRDSMESLNEIELKLAQTKLHDFLEAKYSYLSVVELGLYESSMKTYASLAEQGIEPHTPAWNEAIQEVLKRQKDAMSQRLYPSIPPAKYLCFYPMDRKREPGANWYTLPMQERQRLMHDHGMIGRRYGDRVRQVISGSIGLDDWEWGVDLFADDPVVFKQLIYEMRFDETSALYASFGQFFIGLRVQLDEMENWFQSKSASR
ncbi:hydrogen peroxide-dependent heme synthase [Acidobacterium sp. S8]|uniref:hydrogen peroxide-dependent heme synthase n=1 Tax=Acidobacterium sp. S8 TaxID=1641854 RepID=UPI00131B6A5B|nr:hydrogen peroxide-dependent heme synthase [Acidobacterium sp. S8]